MTKATTSRSIILVMLVVLVAPSLGHIVNASSSVSVLSTKSVWFDDFENPNALNNYFANDNDCGASFTRSTDRSFEGNASMKWIISNNPVDCKVDERVTRTYPADTMGLGVWFTFSDSFRSVAAGNWIVLSLEWWTTSHRYEAKVIYQPESGAPRWKYEHDGGIVTSLDNLNHDIRPYNDSLVGNRDKENWAFMGVTADRTTNKYVEIITGDSLWTASRLPAGANANTPADSTVGGEGSGMWGLELSVECSNLRPPLNFVIYFDNLMFTNESTGPVIQATGNGPALDPLLAAVVGFVVASAICGVMFLARNRRSRRRPLSGTTRQ